MKPGAPTLKGPKPARRTPNPNARRPMPLDSVEPPCTDPYAVVWEGRSREAPPYPDCATALRVTAPPGCGSRRLVWPKGSLSARQAQPENPPRGVLLGASPSIAIERYQMRYKITG